MRSRRSWPEALLALALALSGCDSTRDQHVEFLEFGTIVAISAYDVSDTDFEVAVQDLEAHFAVLGRDWYPWAEGELQRANAAIASGVSIDVSPELQSLIQSAAGFEAISRGRFNAGLGHLSELWGLHDLPAQRGTRPAPADIAAILDGRPGARTLDWQGSTLVPRNSQTMLDLGGIAKGAILNEGIRRLRAHGIHDAIINLGGDLTVLGNVNGRDAHVGIRSPDGEIVVGGLLVSSGESVFTSGNYERFIEIDGIRYPHILDPASGEPVRHTVSVTVVHRDALLADAAATALLVGGVAGFDELCRAFGLDFALLIDASGDARLTPGMRQRLHWPEADESQ